MKRTIIISALALLVGIGTSCQKEQINNTVGGNDNDIKTEFILRAGINISGTKVTYAEEGTDLKPSWSTDCSDQIIGFGSDNKTYTFKVQSIDANGVATFVRVAGGTATSDPADGTTMYLMYAPGKTAGDISSQSLTVDISEQSKDVVPALMMASGTVSGGSLDLKFDNVTAIIAIKNPTMATASYAYTSIKLSGTGVNTEVTFSLSGQTLQATYDTPGTITKAVEFTSGSDKAVSGVTYIVACPQTTEANLTFSANGEKLIMKDKTLAANNYYYMTPTFAMPTYDNTGLQGIRVGDVIWAPVNCGYDASNYKYGKLYQWGRAVGGGYVSSPAQAFDDAGGEYQIAETSASVSSTANTNPVDNVFYKGIYDSDYDWYITTGTRLSSWPMDSSHSQYVAGKIANPCPEGWRVPSDAELRALLGSHTSGALQDGNHGTLTNIKGRYFDGSTAATPTSGVFLPAAGCRLYYSDKTSYRGSDGDYWSSSSSANSAGGMFFYGSSAFMSSGGRANAYSVRCVQE